MEEEILNVSEFAAQMRVSEDTVKRWIKQRQIPYELHGPYRVKKIRVTEALSRPVKENGHGK